MKLLLSAALAATTAAAQGSIAHVNDPVSPGTLGDQLLSLDEAIRVVNGSLALAQLSSTERAQITAAAETAIEIDAAVTPAISLLQSPSPVDGLPGGGAVTIRGAGGRPVIDAAGVAYALRLRSNEVDVVGLSLKNGTDGVVADVTAAYAAGRTQMLSGLEFGGQSGAGVVLSSPGLAATTQTMLAHSTFRSLGNAIVIDDHSQGAAIRLDVEYCTFDDVQRAADLFIDATGSMTLCRMWRCAMPKGNQAVRIRRAPASDQRSMLMIVASDFTTTGDTVDAQGTPLVETAVHVHHSVFRPAAGRKAFLCGPADGRIDFHLSENVVHGDIVVSEGRLNRRLWAWNNVFVDGAFDITNLGTQTSFRWNRFERCAIRAMAASTARMLHVSSEFHACTIEGLSFLGDVVLENCWLDATTTNGSVSQNSPSPSPWLALTDASTDQPVLGGHVDLTLDLPVGMAGVWELGIADPRLVLTQEPWRDYAFPGGHILLPGIFVLRTTVRLPVPVDQALVGLEVYCMAKTGSYLGQSHMPLISLPRGAHLTIGQ